MKKSQSPLFLHSNFVTIQLAFLALLGLVCSCNGITGIDDIEFEGTDSVTTTDNATTTDNTISSDSTTSTASTTSIDTNSDSTVDSDSATNDISSTDSNIHVDTATTTSEQNTDTTTWDCGSGIEMDRNCNANGDAQRIDDCGDVIETIQCAETNGICFGGRCGCEDGWTGENCDTCVVYVNNKLNDFTSNGGRSWEQAVETIQSGIAIAEALGCDVWVSAGTYYPTELIDTADPQSATIQLVSGVNLYGGFLGNEDNIAQRTVSAYETIISGDIGIKNNISDNASDIITGADDVIFDGFTVSGGGTGMRNIETSPTVQNCIFEHNNGGGMYNKSSTLSVINSIFRLNNGPAYGAGIHNETTDLVISNCQFIENNTTGSAPVTLGGGAIYSFEGSLLITNSSFVKNSAEQGVGTMYTRRTNVNIFNSFFETNVWWMLHLTESSTDGATNNLVNCTIIYHNTSKVISGLANFTIKNSIIWGTLYPEDDEIINANINYDFTITNSLVSGGWVGAGNKSEDPKFVEFNTGDYRLASNSPCIDKGNTDSLPTDVNDIDNNGITAEDLPVDLDGNIRVSGASVDMGAYEFQQ